jgi:DNA-3-methyladenine glycosylase
LNRAANLVGSGPMTNPDEARAADAAAAGGAVAGRLADACTAARWLVGAVIERSWRGSRDVVRARIVEVEAYTQDDPASHSFGGERRRNATMFRASGRLYVYRSYGVHWCANVVTGPEGRGEAVLLRAAEVIEGEARVRELRGRAGLRAADLLRGPGNLTRGLGLSDAEDGLELAVGVLATAAVESRGGDGEERGAAAGGGDGGGGGDEARGVRLWLPAQRLPVSTIAVGSRVGISRAIEAPRRWWVRGHACVSRRPGGDVEAGGA